VFSFEQMVTVNSLQAIYKLLSASPDTTTLSKQLNGQLINVRMLIFTEFYKIGLTLLFEPLMLVNVG